MAKWVSPAEQQRREIDRYEWQARPAVKTAVDVLVADWNPENTGELPGDWEHQLTVTVRLAVGIWNDEQGLDAQKVRFVVDRLVAALGEPLRQRSVRERRERERAAEALVDTQRPIVATVRSTHAVGEPVILKERDRHSGQWTRRVLVCIGAYYRPADYEDNEDGGSYCDLAEPTDAERATEPFQRVQAQVDAERAEAEAEQRAFERNRAAAREEEREAQARLEAYYAAHPDKRADADLQAHGDLHSQERPPLQIHGLQPDQTQDGAASGGYR